MKAKLSFSKKIMLCLSMMVWGFGMQVSMAQMSCAPGSVNVPIDVVTCDAIISVDMVTTAFSGAAADYTVSLEYPAGTNTYSPPHTVDATHAKMTLSVTVTHVPSGNQCWTSVLIEDKAGPAIVCPSDDYIDCDEVAAYMATPPAFPATATDCSDFVITYEDDDTNLDLCIASSFDRIWTATDDCGNSSTCVQVINVTPNPRPAIVWPLDLTLPCPESIDGLDPDDLEARYGANNPYSNPSLPTNDYCGQISFSYDDDVFYTCLPATYAFKIRRIWEALDWCDQTWSAVDTQYIIVQDDIAPMVTCPADVTIGTTSSDCEATLPVSPITVTDNCDPNAGVVAVYYYNRFGNLIGTYTGSASTLPIVSPGEYTAVYQIEDACGNQVACNQNITVIDNVAPTAVCFQNIVVSLSNDGWAEVCVAMVNDRSRDNCRIDSMRVRLPNLPSPQNVWGRCATVFCKDIGTQIIELGVWDRSENFNTCWANLTIEDKVAPQITCPPDVTVDCTVDYSDPANTGGYAEVLDACNNLTPTYVDDITSHSCPGPFTRTWTVEKTIQSHSGPVTLVATCTQTITVEDNTPVVVEFPEDITLDCATVAGTDPSDLAVYNYTDDNGTPNNLNDDVYHFFDEPIIDSDCENLGVSKSDEVFDLCLPNAYKIRRTWHVIDWCDPSFDLTHYQEIVVADDEAPELFVDDLTVSILNNDPDCHEYVDLIATSDDNCSAVTITNDSAFSDNGSGADASGYYPKGTHTVCFRATDACGNFTTKCILVTVVDEKAPAAVCTSLTIDIKPTLLAEVTPQMLDAGSTDNCTADANLNFLVQLVDDSDNPLADPAESIIFDCDQLGFNYVRLWVFDGTPLASNGDYCVTTVYVQDNFDRCPSSTTTAPIAGTVKTEAGDAINNVDVYLDGTPITYSFPGFQTDATTGQNHTITAEKLDGGRNGVTTWDIVKIRQHILNIDQFNSAYKWIAADVNKDGNVSTSDILYLRQYILNAIQDLPNNNTSWRFIDEEYTFTTNNPLSEPFPEYINMMHTSAYMNADFVGVKVGDVSGDVNPSQLTIGDDRNASGTLELVINEGELNRGDQVSIDITADNFEDILGFQFTVNFDASSLEYAGLEAGSLDITDANFGLGDLAQGMIAVSWDSNAAVTADTDEVLFSIVFNTQSKVLVSESISINSRLLQAEGYTAGYELKDVNLTFRSLTSAASEFVLYQNTPNPFSNYTLIGFDLPSESEAQINVYDVTGKVIYTKTGEYTRGYNEVRINRDELNTAGILYYEVVSQEFRASKKMIFIAK